MGWVVYAARLGKVSYAYKIFVGQHSDHVR
jgi:hypothetical protein